MSRVSQYEQVRCTQSKQKNKSFKRSIDKTIFVLFRFGHGLAIGSLLFLHIDLPPTLTGLLPLILLIHLLSYLRVLEYHPHAFLYIWARTGGRTFVSTVKIADMVGILESLPGCLRRTDIFELIYLDGLDNIGVELIGKGTLIGAVGK